MNDLYPLPRDTLEAFRRAQAKCWNLGLLFERYTSFGPNWTLEGKDKFGVFKGLKETAERARVDASYKQLIGEYHRRWLEVVKASGASDDCIFTASPEWRLAVGLGRESALETGFTFHRLYGFPYIPGSTLKGLTQAWALWQVAERCGVAALVPGERRDGPSPVQKLEETLMAAASPERSQALGALGLTDEDAETYQAVFGTQRSRGRVVFFDAVPVEPPTLAVDVMNPHYGDYYQKKPGVPPADYLSPVPVYFLTVQAGSRFAFAVASHEPELARHACEWLKEALSNLGAGAKTSAGYGYFELPQTSSSSPTAAAPPTVQAQTGQPVTQAPSVQRHTSRGQVRYDGGKPYVVDTTGESTLRLPVDWKMLGMDALGNKTPVEYEYEELAGGRRKVVRVTKVKG